MELASTVVLWFPIGFILARILTTRFEPYRPDPKKSPMCLIDSSSKKIGAAGYSRLLIVKSAVFGMITFAPVGGKNIQSLAQNVGTLHDPLVSIRRSNRRLQKSKSALRG
jgi:hypothetical protein